MQRTGGERKSEKRSGRFMHNWITIPDTGSLADAAAPCNRNQKANKKTTNTNIIGREPPQRMKGALDKEEAAKAKRVEKALREEKTRTEI